MENIEQKIVILGGIHGDDTLGLEVLKYFFQKNNPRLQLLIGNYQALEQKKKFVDFDLLDAGIGDVSCTTSVEKCRAGELHQVLSQYPYAVSIHGSHVLDNVAIILNTDPKTIHFAQSLGVSSIIAVNETHSLLSPVPHAVILVRKVAVRPEPSHEEVVETILIVENIAGYDPSQSVSTSIPIINATKKIGEIIEEGV